MKLNHNCELLSYEDQIDRKKWFDLYQSFRDVDIFYYPEYAKLFEIHGDGEAFLFVYYQSSKDIVIYPFLKRSLRQISWLKDIEHNLYDITSPYGYGGYLPSSSIIDMEKFFTCFHNYCKDNNIISEFVRFHPILENVRYVSKNIKIKHCNETIYIDLKDEMKNIWHNMAPRCRNSIRKAINNDIKIIFDENFSKIDMFYKLYKETMTRLIADDYYFFSKNWFHSLVNLLKNKVALVHAEYQGKIISSAIFIYDKYIINYFLTGSLFETRHLSANNLILYEVSLWAKKMGIRFLHLGGGYRANDSLFHFKKSFSPLRTNYFVGGVIHNPEYYNYICNLKYEQEEDKNHINYFPLYRFPN